MSKSDIEVVLGSGNVFWDLCLPDPELRQLKTRLAAEVIRVLDGRKLSVRKAEELTGIAAVDFSLIRKVKLDRVTVDLLMTILDRLEQDVEVSVSVHPRAPANERLLA